MTRGSHSCWSFVYKVCEECAPEGGMQCSNHHKWYCDDCAAAKSFDGVWECPGCRELFCHDCRGIERCFACGASSLCERCAKTGKGTKGSAEEGVVGAQLEWECSGCEGKMCKKCKAEGLVKTCDNCSEDVCNE